MSFKNKYVDPHTGFGCFSYDVGLIPGGDTSCFGAQPGPFGIEKFIISYPCKCSDGWDHISINENDIWTTDLCERGKEATTGVYGFTWHGDDIHSIKEPNVVFTICLRGVFDTAEGVEAMNGRGHFYTDDVLQVPDVC